MWSSARGARWRGISMIQNDATTVRFEVERGRISQRCSRFGLLARALH
jgi:hypothetical protein